jgi:hypothetical protein
VIVVSCRDDRTWGAEVVEKELGIGADIERKNDTEFDCRGLREHRVFLATPVKHPTPALSSATTRTYPQPGRLRLFS